jgi:hypothetical protein
MKYTVSVDILVPRDRVIALFDDAANLKRWMPGMRGFEHLSGVPGQPGAKSRLTFLHKGRELVMTETITQRQLPDRYDHVYEMNGTENAASHRFFVTGPDSTRWEQTTSFEFSGLLMKAMALLAPGMFKKQTLMYMECFKTFAESQTDEGLERTRFEPQ